MRQKPLGTSDLTVGAIAYGCWRFADTNIKDAISKIETALDCGMSLIDTADIYGFGEPAGFGGAEAKLGNVLAARPDLREHMTLATKGGIIPPRPYDSSYDYLMAAIDASLTRLGVDQVDLYQIHRPDLIAPLSETARALDDMVKTGKTRFIGVSNFTVAQTRALQAHLDAPIVSTQPEFSAIEQSPITDGTLDWSSETGATVLAWSPLAGGALATGNYTEADKTRFGRIMETVKTIAKSHDATTTQVALAFTLFHQANIIPIIGTQHVDRIKEAAAATELTLEAREFYDIIEAYRDAPMP